MTVQTLLSPSERLPPVRRISEHSVDALSSLVDYLRTIYNPPVRGARRIDRKDSEYAGKAENDDADVLAHIRADEFERAHAVRWLTGLISQAALIPADCEERADALICAAAALIAVCTGTAAARTLTRTYAFRAPLLGPGKEVAVRLTDVPIAVDAEQATVGTQTWGGACLLAEMLVEDPARFGLTTPDTGGSLRGEGVRVLELGAGTGLVGLACASVLSSIGVGAGGLKTKVTIVASDYHPIVLKNLHANIEANFPGGAPSQVSISAHALDWSRYASGSCSPSTKPELPFHEPFDVILGADIVYEIQHARWIQNCVSALLRKPSTADSTSSNAWPRFHLVMPLRPTHVSESRAVEEAFPAAPRSSSPTPRSTVAPQLCVLEKETILCEMEDARPRAEVEYVHYVIGWTYG